MHADPGLEAPQYTASSLATNALRCCCKRLQILSLKCSGTTDAGSGEPEKGKKAARALQHFMISIQKGLPIMIMLSLLLQCMQSAAPERFASTHLEYIHASVR